MTTKVGCFTCCRLNNCRQAMKLARQHFDIPLVLRPEDLSSPQLDEKSAILYLSYFTRVGGPGYNATMERVQKRLKMTQISNFTVSCRSFFFLFFWWCALALRER